ncbi:MAG: hypothetical protein ACI4CT_01780 [Lachnospiraceae bacterium]
MKRQYHKPQCDIHQMILDDIITDSSGSTYSAVVIEEPVTDGDGLSGGQSNVVDLGGWESLF